MEKESHSVADPDILEVCHGRIIPEYSSAYALRCRRYLDKFPGLSVISVGGLIFRDQAESNARQFRSLVMTGMAFLKGGRSLEILLSKGQYMRRKYLKILRSYGKSARVIIFEGPWQYRLVKDQIGDKIVVYDAHNVESVLRKGDPWEEYTLELEGELATRADLIITVSNEDALNLSRIHGVPETKVMCIPEGFEHLEKTWKGMNSRELVFIGSAYLPNVQAVNNLIKIANLLPDFQIKIIGSVSESFKKSGVPSNVKFLGMIDDVRKREVICNSLFALNPVEKGSGRNLKMNDYISHGIPIITTEIGSRGFDEDLRKHFFTAPVEEFPERIEELQASAELLTASSEFFLRYSREHSYETTVKLAHTAISSLLAKSQSKR